MSEKTYSVSLSTLEALANLIGEIDAFIDIPLGKAKVNAAHEIIERILGDDAALLYDQDDEADGGPLMGVYPAGHEPTALDNFRRRYLELGLDKAAG